MEPQHLLSGVGTVVSGEASESDEEDVHFPLNLHPSLHGIMSQPTLCNVSICQCSYSFARMLIQSTSDICCSSPALIITQH